MKSKYKISCILLAGGKGTRMKETCPKTFLPLQGKPIVLHSLEILQSSSLFEEIIVVCEKEFHHLFSAYSSLLFALPGRRRQDSVFSALQKVSVSSTFVCIHDGARPFLTQSLLQDVIKAGIEHQAATLAIPVTHTITECSKDLFIQKTLARSSLYEMQTPQVISKSLLERGFASLDENIEVTDDVSLIQRLSIPVKIVNGSPSNIKITYPLDLRLAQFL
jgi:2-C-methyl-D-erythritol 4-phosphate cytidylyltransferase